MEGNSFKSSWVKRTLSVLNRAPNLSPANLQTYQMCLGGEAVDVRMLQDEDFLWEFELSEVPVVNVKVDNKALAAAAAEARKKEATEQASKKGCDKGKAMAIPSPGAKVVAPLGVGNKPCPLIIGAQVWCRRNHPKKDVARVRKLSDIDFSEVYARMGDPFSLKRRRCLRFKNFVPRAASRPDGGSSRKAGGRRVYKQSKASGLPLSSAQELVSLAVPAGVFVVVTFVIWKLVEKLLVPKSGRASQEENKSSVPGIKWSFAPGTNLSSGNSFKIERESRQRLNDFSKELRSFRNVDISGCNFGDEGLFFLAESLGYNQSAEEVDFSANGITEAGMKAFDGVLQSNFVLKSLNLSGNPIGDGGAKCLSDILVGNSGIQKLQLNSTGLSDEGAKAISEMLKRNSSLRVLELDNNMIDYSGFTSLAGALLENNTIRTIHLNGNYGGALGAAALAKGIEGNKSLRELRLNGNSIGNEGVRALMTGLSGHKGKVTLLDLGNNEIGPKGAFHVAEFIKKSKSLLWLNLYMNDIGDEGAERIAEALKENRTITTIDLGGNNIHASGVHAIAQILKDNPVIKTLDLGYNPFGPDGAKSLSEVLKFHGKIETLKLGWCQIGVKGAEFIADTLKYNTTISTLDLRANGLGDEGAICLARSLKVVNEVLTSLDLGYNEIRDKGAFAIAQALKANEDVAITSLNLANNFFTKYGQGALTDARDLVFEMSEKEVNIFF
ncbi:LOW QUALITY PROTEIN: protein NLRC3 [Macadamia integrifolia]|uniref:LOW QUALITY PROTEIN: protein NLRC3 n=1 Tax=Macadamia integrifolia TaxID=60698 RepID=UPI001C4EAE3B|nr:LOW QUALITY PROTEIN: protein NLRC3 [Macadamia integrifolia]